MMKTKRWVSWTVEWAPHVSGSYEAGREVDASGMPEPQQVRALCSVCKAKCKCRKQDVCSCGAEWRGSCSTGAVRSHISRFAGVHMGCAGRDPLKTPPPHRSG